jgi:VanZ family protein
MNDKPAESQRKYALTDATAMMVAVLSLLSMTVGLFEFAPRYEAIGGELLNNSNFGKQLEGWTSHSSKGAVEVASGVAVLKNLDPSRSVGIKQTLSVPLERGLLQLSADLATGNVHPGDKPWQAARVYLVGQTDDGKFLWHIPNRLTLLTGTNPWDHYSAIFSISENMKEMVLAVQLDRSTGTIQVRNLNLVSVKELRSFQMAAYILLAAWVVALSWIGFYLLRNIASDYSRTSVAVVGVTIIIGVLIPSTVKHEILTWLRDAYEHLRPMLSDNLPKIEGRKEYEPEYMGVSLSQLGHFTLFFVLAMLIQIVRPLDRQIQLLLGLLLFAAVTEALQNFVPSRSAEVLDWSFDGGGIILAFTAISLFRALRRMTKADTAVGDGGPKLPFSK